MVGGKVNCTLRSSAALAVGSPPKQEMKEVNTISRFLEDAHGSFSFLRIIVHRCMYNQVVTMAAQLLGCYVQNHSAGAFVHVYVCTYSST